MVCLRTCRVSSFWGRWDTLSRAHEVNRHGRSRQWSWRLYRAPELYVVSIFSETRKLMDNYCLFAVGGEKKELVSTDFKGF